MKPCPHGTYIWGVDDDKTSKIYSTLVTVQPWSTGCVGAGFTVINRVDREGRTETETFEKRPQSGKRPALQVFQGRAFQAEGTARVKDLRWECAWSV